MAIDPFKGITNESWSINYDDESVLLTVERSGHPHLLSVENKKGFSRNPWEVFFRLLNEIVWFYDIEAWDLNGSHGDFAANAYFTTTDDSYAIQLAGFEQRVFDKAQHLALGFFREAVSCGSPYYAFLCYSKIIEIPFKNGKAKGNWIDQEIPKLSNGMAVTLRDRKVDVLGGKSLGYWLHQDGRHALAHANIQGSDLVRDPNSYKDWDEIKWGNVVMKELAEKIITNELNVPNRNT